jgi:hypothetical protein
VKKEEIHHRGAEGTEKKKRKRKDNDKNITAVHFLYIPLLFLPSVPSVPLW